MTEVAVSVVAMRVRDAGSLSQDLVGLSDI